jgi:hypothetical protein
MRRLTIVFTGMLVAGSGGVAAAQLDDEADPDEGGESEEEEESPPMPPDDGGGVEGGAGTEVTPPVVTPEPEAVEESPSWAQLIEIHGFASFGYTFNVNQPDSNGNDFRIFDLGHNNMTLDVAELTVMHPAADKNDVGFRVDFEVGTTVPIVSSSIGLGKVPVDLDGDGVPDTFFAEQWDLQQAYVTWVAPAGDAGLRIDAGKFVTWAGAEVIEGWDGFNDNYSRGFLFGYAVPFAHTGVRAGYPVNDKVTISGMLVNGWDVAIDNNEGKTWGLNAAIAATDTVNAYVTYIGGPEQDGESDLRHLIDLVATAKVGEQLTVTGNVDFGTEAVGDDSVSWYGLAAYARYAVDDQISIAGRAELFMDPDNARTGTAFPDGHQLIGITATPAYKVGDHVVLRADLRLDLSNEDAFEKKDMEATSSQFTIGLNALAYY